MPGFIDLTGKRFGRLTVIDRAPDKIGPKGYRETYWNCICDCGNNYIVQAKVCALRKLPLVAVYEKKELAQLFLEKDLGI